jgi:hypothetical protein
MILKDSKKSSVPAAVSALLVELRNQKARRTEQAVELEAAEKAVAEVRAEASAFRAAVSAQEAELARTGAEIPDAFVEDDQIARAERKARILSLRVASARQELQSCEAEVSRLNGELEREWLAFGQSLHREALANYEQQAIALRGIVGDILALAAFFKPLKLVWPECILGSVSTADAKKPGGGAFVNTLDRVWFAINPTERQELYLALCATRAEITRAQADSSNLDATMEETYVER